MWDSHEQMHKIQAFVGGLGLSTGAVPSPFLEFLFIFLTFRATRLQSLHVTSLLVSVRSWGGSLATSAGREEKRQTNERRQEVAMESKMASGK